jgi:hypothetical protein
MNVKVLGTLLSMAIVSIIVFVFAIFHVDKAQAFSLDLGDNKTKATICSWL